MWKHQHWSKKYFLEEKDSRKPLFEVCYKTALSPFSILYLRILTVKLARLGSMAKWSLTASAVPLVHVFILKMCTWFIFTLW